jgi:hypothetical protein
VWQCLTSNRTLPRLLEWATRCPERARPVPTKNHFLLIRLTLPEHAYRLFVTMSVLLVLLSTLRTCLRSRVGLQLENLRCGTSCRCCRARLVDGADYDRRTSSCGCGSHAYGARGGAFSSW